MSRKKAMYCGSAVCEGSRRHPVHAGRQLQESVSDAVQGLVWFADLSLLSVDSIPGTSKL